MCRNCGVYQRKQRDPKTLLSVVEVKNQMNALEFRKGLITSELEDVNKRIEDLRKKCPHKNYDVWPGYDDDTNVCKDCGLHW